ncbi:transcriptional repressor [Candidatus Peribacteria bacterium]|nr:transcriptional repressor [Candidatus Peribacteria bacterium]
MKRTEFILQSLRQNGHRITKARRALIKALLRTKQPVAALELHARISKSKVAIDRVTVYRELKFLADIGVVHPVNLKDNIQRYEIAPVSGHKHHLVCTACKTVKNVNVACADLHNLEALLGKKNNFIVREHSLEFYGLCAHCA